MRIKVDDDRLRDELAAVLTGVGCEARAIGRTLDVTHVESPAQPLELRFFLRAWLARHPNAHAEFIA